MYSLTQRALELERPLMKIAEFHAKRLKPETEPERVYAGYYLGTRSCK